MKKQTYTKTETCKLYSRVFWIFLPNAIKIDPHNFELYRFKICAFLRHSVHCTWPGLGLYYFVVAIFTCALKFISTKGTDEMIHMRTLTMALSDFWSRLIHLP